MIAKTKSKAKVTAGAPAWGVSTLRFTAFSQEPPALDQAVWDRTAKFQPTNVRSLPFAIMSGSSDDGTLTMQASGPKLDIILQPRVEKGEPPNPVASMGPLLAAFSPFRGFVSRYLAKKPKIVRMAFGLIQHAPAATAGASAQLLLRQLPDIKLRNAIDVTDFFFQVNRPRLTDTLSEKGGTRINRLSKWSSVQVVTAFFQTGAAELRTVNVPPEFYAKLELDVNTAADRTKSLPPGKLLSLFDELYGQAEEITRKGDIP
jgi:hypothetical protein